MKKLDRVNKSIYIKFVDFEKVFDNVNRKKLFIILKNININTKYRRITKELYLKEKEVLIENEIESYEERMIEQKLDMNVIYQPHSLISILNEH